ncbi:MAG: hypothetical protein KY468_19495 [Armatimonadetes bacterium]|nr:hypothetical protein [Armatimonadota bacterium]
MPEIRLALCDRHTLLRTALEQMLAAEEEIEVIWSAASLEEAISAGRSFAPDLLLLDFTSPTLPFLNRVKQFHVACPETQIVAMTDHGTDVCVLFEDRGATLGIGQPRTCCLQKAFMMGARGAVRKTGTREELLRVLRDVHAGRVSVEEPSLSLLLSRLLGPNPTSAPETQLTDRELVHDH